MGVIVVPVLDGKADTQKAWIGDLNRSRKDEFRELNTRYGLTRHVAWPAETPAGAMAIVLVEGSGHKQFTPKLGPSDHTFDSWFKEKVFWVHGLDMANPAPMAPPANFPDARV